MPIMVIAKKSCRVMIEPPEKGAGDRAIGRDGSVPAADFFVRKIPERAKIIFPDQPSLPWRQKRPVEQLDVNPAVLHDLDAIGYQLAGGFFWIGVCRSDANFICHPSHAKGATRAKAKAPINGHR
jgi:hypothetical protein